MKHVKNIFGLFSLSFILLSASNCGSSQGDKSVTFEKNAPFVISEIYSQDWVAGVKEGGSGTNVHVTFESMNEGVVMKEIYFKNKSVNVMETGVEKNQFTGYFKNVPKDRIMDSDPIKEAQNTPEKKSPFELLDNEVVLSYAVNGQKQYFKVLNVIKKPRIAYPSKKPDGTE